MPNSSHKGFIASLRPLLLWLLFILVLYGIRLNERLLDQTRLYFSVSFQGEPLPYPISVACDDKPITSGERISLGNHHFAITGPKTDSFITNLVVWYGRHDLGDIRLIRSMGSLAVADDPPAQSITITGPEFSTTLQNCSGTNLTVPTDTYDITAQYRRWSDSRNISVSEGTVSSVAFSPKFAMVDLSCNRNGATYHLQSENGQIEENGILPATVNDLPTAGYHATIIYHGRTIQKSFLVQTGVTNDVPFEFDLGAVRLETVPNGAEVHMADGNYLGQTPLLLPDMTPQTAQFTLSLSGYEPVSVILDIAAGQTNSYSTNLVGVGYLSAMGHARAYLERSDFEAAAQAATAALNAKPGAEDALAIQNEAENHLEAKRLIAERLQRPKKWFDRLCSEYPDANLFAEHQLETVKSAADVVSGIVTVLTNSPNVFKIVRTASPEIDTYEIVGQQTGFLDATERDCLIVIGSPREGDTQIRFKVLELQIEHHLSGDNQLIPMSQSKTENNGLLLLHVMEGLQIMTDKIKAATKN